MAEKRPVCLYSGSLEELASGDTLPGAASNNWLHANNGLDFTTAPIGTGSNNISLGNSANSNVAADNIAIGTGALVNGNFGNNVVIGRSARSSAWNGIAIGDQGKVIGSYGVSIGYLCDAGGNSIAIGNNADGFGTDNIAIGHNIGTATVKQNQIVLGESSILSLDGQVSIGAGITAADVTTDTEYSVKLGYAFTSTADKNLLHLFSKGKLELYGAEAQYVMPGHTTVEISTLTGVEGGIVIDSTTKDLNYNDGTSWVSLGNKDYVNTAFSNRNVIINGNINVWQRGTSFPAITSGSYSADRFAYHYVGIGAYTAFQSGIVPTYAQSGTKSNYSLSLSCTAADTSIAAGDHYSLAYPIEGYDYARIAGGDATLSFWVMGAKTGVHCVSFRNYSVSKTYVAEYTIAAANTWQKVEITIPLTETAGTWNYENGVGLYISFILASGTTHHTTADAWQTGNFLSTAGQVNELDGVANNFRIVQVQFEKGSVATPFEYRSIADDITGCERYYQHLLETATFVDGYNTTSSFYTLAVPFQTTMRDTPTLTAPSSTGPVNVAAVVLSGTDTSETSIRVQVTTTGRAYTTLQDLIADAEF